MTRATPETPESTHIWVVAPAQVARVRRRITANQVAWCYLGTNLRQRDAVAAVYARDTQRHIGDELSHVAYKIRQTFLDWISAVGCLQRDPVTWWGSRLASRSPLQSDAFLLVCYAELVSGWLSRDPSGPTQVVVIEDPWLLWLLRRRYSGDTRVAFPYDAMRNVVTDAMCWLVRVPWAAGSFFLWAMISTVWCRLIFKRENLQRSEQEKHLILIYTWIIDSCFSKEGNVQDVYTGRLAELLKSCGEEVKRFTPLKIGIMSDLRKKIKKHASAFMVTPLYTSLADVLRATIARFRIDNVSSVSRFREYNLKPLLYRELLHEWGDVEFSGYNLWYLTVRRLAMHCRGSVKMVIYPFENQPWEKLMCLAFRQEAPSVRLIGYQHTLLGTLLLNHFLGEGESRRMPLPEQIIASGPMSYQLLAEGGYLPNQLAQGGAFRFEHLFRISRQLARRRRTPNGVRLILVALPISPPHATALLNDLVKLFPTPTLTRTGEQVEFLVKGHPFLPVGKLMRGKTLPVWFNVTDKPLTDLFAISALFLYVAPTTTSWEAHFSGLPVLKYQGEWLDLDALDGAHREIFPTCSRDSLIERLEALLGRSGEGESDGSSRPVLTEFFAPVDERLWTGLAVNTTPQPAKGCGSNLGT